MGLFLQILDHLLDRRNPAHILQLILEDLTAEDPDDLRAVDRMMAGCVGHNEVIAFEADTIRVRSVRYALANIAY